MFVKNGFILNLPKKFTRVPINGKQLSCFIVLEAKKVSYCLLSYWDYLKLTFLCQNQPLPKEYGKDIEIVQLLDFPLLNDVPLFLY
jgi:hypothetical protein